jgi:hypothetical protein
MQICVTRPQCVKVGLYYYGMVCCQVVDGGDGLLIWRVAPNVLNFVVLVTASILGCSFSL